MGWLSLGQSWQASAEQIGTRWVAQGTGGSTPALHYIDTGPQDSSVRNQEALRPFHRFEAGEVFAGHDDLAANRFAAVVPIDAGLDRHRRQFG